MRFHFVLIILSMIKLIFVVVAESRIQLKIKHQHLPQCEGMAICNIIHNRFWLSNAIEKLCECPADMHCGSLFDTPNNYTMTINRRSQMKFCSSVHTLSACSDQQIALTRRVVETARGIQQNASVTLHCYCPLNRYWRYSGHQTSIIDHTRRRTSKTDSFQCQKMGKCKAFKFCGHARSDYGIIYHRCICPNGYDCVYDTDSELYENKTELLYSGTVYRAKCMPSTNYDYNW